MISVTTEQHALTLGRRLLRAVAIGACCLPLLFGATAHAFETVLEDRYVLHEDITVNQARELLHSRLREEGARQAGSYVARETRLTEGGDLTESVTLLTAAMIEAETLEDTLAVNEQGLPVLTLRVRLAVDDRVLQDRISALHRDHEQQLALEHLTRQNRHLQHELRALIDVTYDAAEASRRARRAEDLLASITRHRHAVSEVVDQAGLQESISASHHRHAELQHRLMESGAELALALSDQLSVSIDRVSHRGDMMLLDVVVSGLGGIRHTLQDWTGLPFNDQGMIARREVDAMSPDEKDRFFAHLEVLANFPFFIRVEASQPGMHEGRHDVVSQLLLGTVSVRPGLGGYEIASEAQLRPEQVKEVALSNTLPPSLALAVVGASPRQTVDFESNGDLRFRLQLAAGGGDPRRLEAKVRLLPWAFYRN